ncbi:hypothetical protein HOO65_090079 [Ceratocystis lukuohia]|uniref:Uncharacterized protein n=1 Tax=Ceratocystis lukuohia TaxID=2019550 RepID=A0ABR4M937_9PEZI
MLQLRSPSRALPASAPAPPYWSRLLTLSFLPFRYDLPPDRVALPLPALSAKERREVVEAKKKRKTPANDDAQHSRPQKKRIAEFSSNDAPRAFKRIMRLAHKKQAGTITTTAPQKPKLNRQAEAKKKAAAKAMEKAAAAELKKAEDSKVEVPKIQPGERLSDFAARVDQSIPVVGLANKMQKNGKDVLGLKVHRTRKEKKMHKLYDQWRAEERKIQSMRDEEAEKAAERDMDSGYRLMDNGIMDGFSYDSLRSTGPMDREDGEGEGGGKKKKKKQKRGGGSKKAEDPWAILLKKRGEGRVKLHDVAQAPPELNMKMDVKLKTYEKPE